MVPSQLLIKLALVAGQGAVLYLLSRSLFVWVLQALASRHPRKRGGRLVHLVRLPGNLLHEVSHAIGFLVCGYRVRRLVLSLFDREGAGACQPGRPWLPLAVPWLATGVAALAPLVVGALVLRALAEWLGIPLGAEIVPTEPSRSVLDSLYEGLATLDYRAWQTWLFLYLAFSIGAELAPSATDVRLGLPALLVVSGLTAAVVVAVYQLAPEAPLRVTVLGGVRAGLEWLSAVFSFALVATGVVTVLTFLPASLVRSARG